VYADDIWVAKLDGANPRRLTSHPGEERNPFFAPDGKHIAFTASYDGNEDVLRDPHRGGRAVAADLATPATTSCAASRLTARCSSARNGRSSRGGTPSSSRSTSAGGSRGPCQSRPPTRVPSRRNRKSLAYTPLGEVFRQWKNYRGGTASRIWVLKLDDLSHEEVPKPAGGCNDTEPMWIGESVYFLSDRDGEFNLYSYNRSSKNVTRCTDHDAFPVASALGRRGQGDLRTGWVDSSLRTRACRKSRRLKIGVAADLTETRPRYARVPSTSARPMSHPAASGR